eukprot:318194_1
MNRILFLNITKRLFYQTEELYRGIEPIIMLWCRCDVMGCSEGRTEGDVKIGDNILRNRWRLKPDKFRMELTIKSILKLLTYDQKKQLQKKVANRLASKPGAMKKVLYVTNKVNPAHYPSKSIANYRAGPNLSKLQSADLIGIDE